MNQRDLAQIQERINQFKLPKIENPKVCKEINAFNIAIDLVSSVIVGVVMGVMLDKLLESKPLCLIMCLLIGILAGFKIIWQKLNNNNNGT